MINQCYPNKFNLIKHIEQNNQCTLLVDFGNNFKFLIFILIKILKILLYPWLSEVFGNTYNTGFYLLDIQNFSMIKLICIA